MSSHQVRRSIQQELLSDTITPRRIETARKDRNHFSRGVNSYGQEVGPYTVSGSSKSVSWMGTASLPVEELLLHSPCVVRHDIVLDLRLHDLVSLAIEAKQLNDTVDIFHRLVSYVLNRLVDESYGAACICTDPSLFELSKMRTASL